MKFNNRENKSYEVDGRVIWDSRSPAVAGAILCAVDSEAGKGVYVLVAKRGENCPNEVGKWCLPCGYMDYDEDGLDAIRRETWEETGVNLDEFIENADKVIYDPYKYRNPWYTNHDPKNDELQNITLHFGAAIRASELPEIKGPQGGEEDETADVKWVEVSELLDGDDYDLAFNHSMRLQQFCVYLIDRGVQLGRMV